MAFHLDKFVPKNVITGMVLAKLDKSLVFSGLVNYANADGLKRGDSYRIPGVGSITIGDYAGTDITVQDIADVNVDIPIDQAKYFAFYLDKVDNYESAMNVLPMYVDRGAYGLASSVDNYIAQSIVAEATAVTGGTIDATNVLDWVASIKVAMDTANVPQEGRWLVVPPNVAGAIAKTNIETASTTLEQARLTGFVQRYLGFDIFMSNNLVDGTVGKEAVAGVPSAYQFIQSISDIEFMDAEKRFASLSKGLLVYGGDAVLGTSNPNSEVALFKSDVA